MITNEVDAADLVRESRPPGFPAKFWKACAKRREVVVLLDAVNEVKREFPAGPTWRLVGKLLGGNHGFTVIATSRDPDEDAGEMRLVRRLKLQDFTSVESHRYLAASGLDSHDCIQWLDAIGLTGASSNPLLLRSLVTLMAEPTTQPDKRLASRAELLRAAALAQVERGPVPPDATRELEAGAVIDAAWAACATRAHFANLGEFSRQQALGLLQACSPSVGAGGVLDLFLEMGPVARAAGRPAGQPRLVSIESRPLYRVGLAIGWGPTDPPTITHNSHFFGGFIADWCALHKNPADTIRRMASCVAAGAHFDTLCDILLADTPLLDLTSRDELWSALGRGFTMGAIRPHSSRLTLVRSLPRALIREGLAAGLLRRLVAERPDVVGHVRDALLTGTLDGRRLQRIYRQAGRRNSVAPARRDLDEGPTGQSDEPAPREAHEAGREDVPMGASVRPQSSRSSSLPPTMATTRATATR